MDKWKKDKIEQRIHVVFSVLGAWSLFICKLEMIYYKKTGTQLRMSTNISARLLCHYPITITAVPNVLWERFLNTLKLVTKHF